MESNISADTAAKIRQQIRQFSFSLQPVSVGTVLQVGDGIAQIAGLEGRDGG